MPVLLNLGCDNQKTLSPDIVKPPSPEGLNLPFPSGEPLIYADPSQVMLIQEKSSAGWPPHVWVELQNVSTGEAGTN